ncbi:MAG: UDP-N-acetylglucosamine 2-epimerase (non-hydrolyzing) [Sulfurimonas sp.]|nr:UDP-N-acetylglucosamine 2-epimerase (non-hydrolyzing) [Sulfurimonas sp.]
MKTIAIVVGTRPEAIKLSPVILEINKYPEFFKTVVVSTGQHRHMTRNIFSFFGLEPDIDLDIMSENQTLLGLTVHALSALGRAFESVTPDAVVVQGDTTTAMVASLCAFYMGIRVIHVEAGLRTHNIHSPFPEEFNRALISIVGEFHFPPTEQAAEQLLASRVAPEKILITGNTGIDALRIAVERLDGIDFEENASLKAILLGCIGKKIILVTGHRRESFGAGLENICHAIRSIVDAEESAIVVYPVHLNPNVREPVGRLLGNHPRIILIEPLDYAPFVFLLKQSYIVLTDSGGIQEEAPFLGKPVLVMREVTERPEGIQAGAAMLVGTHSNQIVEQTLRLFNDSTFYSSMAQKRVVYGDGFAATRIVETLKSVF